MEARSGSSTNPSRPYNRLGDVVVTVAAGGTALLGIAVVVAWHVHIPAILQLYPGYTPMVYNTALCFVFCGAAFVALHRERKQLAILPAALMGVAGILTAFQYLFDANLGIDEWFVSHSITGEATDPGRMAPNTVACFLLSSAALLLLSCCRRAWVPMAAAVMGCATGAIGLNSIIGYATGLRIAYCWGLLTPMALNTALGMFLAGAGTTALAWRRTLDTKAISPRWSPILAGVVVMTLSVGQWQALIARDHAAMARVVDREAHQLDRELTELLANQSGPIARMANRMERRPDQSKAEWEADASLNLKYYPCCYGIAWIEPGPRSTWVALQEDVVSAANARLVLDAEMEETLIAARDARDTRIAQLLPAETSKAAFQVVVPAFVGGRLHGWMVGSYSLPAMLESLHRHNSLLSRLSLSIAAGDARIYGPSVVDPSISANWIYEFDVESYGLRWRAKLWPNRELVAEEHSLVPLVILASGMLLSLLIAVAVALAQAARRSSCRLADLYNYAPCGYLTLDGSGFIAEANDTILRWLDRSRSDVLSKQRLEDWISAQGASEFRRHFATFKAGGSARELEFELVRRDRSLLPVILSATAVRGSDGRFLAGRYTIFDITDRMQAEQLRRVSEERLARIVETIADSIFIVDAGGRITMANAAAEKMLGMTREEITSRTHDDKAWSITRCDGEPFPEAELPFNKVMSSGDPVYGAEVGVERADGRRIIVSVNAAPLCDAAGAPIGMVASVNDVTRRKEVDLLKEELISTVSHELRTPLASLRGFAELMITREFPQEKQREFLKIIHGESVRLTNLINDFLDIQRMESGRQQYEFGAIDFKDVALTSIAPFKLDGSKHEFRIEIPADLPHVWADGDRMRQVMANLVSNAVKFSPQGGNVTIGARAEAGVVTAWVADKGLGIPSELLPKLFGKFFRVATDATRSIGGTGLGLALSKEIVSAHGGRLWVESELGVGSTFFFTVPAVSQGADAAGPASGLAPEPKADILLVEDDPVFCKLLYEHFAADGFAMALSPSGETALELARKSSPRVALVDVHLGGKVDGWDVLVAIKDDSALRSIAVLIISASESINARGLAVGGAEYLLKPVSPAWLVQTVRAQLPQVAGARALVADDDPSFRKQVRECLEPEGLVIEEAANGREALERMAQTMPDLLILDLLMPETDGFEVLRRLRTDRQAVNLPVLVVTGKSLDADEKAYIKRRMATLVRKQQVRLDHIARAVEQALVLKPAR